MAVDPRKIAVAIAGFCTFLNLYSPQALLPALAGEFGVGAAEISTIMTASTLAIALTAPFTGAIADVLGRKRVIAAAMLAVVVPTIGAAFAPDVQALVVWRFMHGLLLPPIFAVTIAYIGDEFPPAEANGVFGIWINSYRRPRFTVRRGVIRKSSCTKKLYSLVAMLRPRIPIPWA